MGKGLSLSSLRLLEKDLQNSLYSVEFLTVDNISISKGLTRLCNDFFFFLLSSYNPSTGVGSKVRQMLGQPLLYSSDKNAAIVKITDELEDCQERFKALQTSRLGLDSVETLDRVRIVSVNVDTSLGTILVTMEIINVLGQRALFQV